MNCTQEMTEKMIASALALYREKPWDLFDEHEVFEIHHAKPLSKAYCLFHRLNGKKCMTVFCGADSFTDLSNMFKLTGLVRVDAFQYYERNCFEVIFDDPDHLEEDYQKIGEAMGYTARELPLVRYYEKRCYADLPTEQEAEKLISILDGLFEGMMAYLSEGMNLDFSKRRFVYDVKKKTCFSKKTGYRPRKYDIVEIDNPELIEELAMLDEMDEVWEYDLQPTVIATRRLKDQRPQPLYLAALANPLTLQVLAGVPFQTEDDFQFQCIDLMIEAIMQRGIPRAVTVRHPLVGAAVMDLCKKLEIELIPVDHFEVLDDFYDGMAEHFEGKMERC